MWSRIAVAALAVVMLVFPLVGCSSDEDSPDLLPHLISTPDENPVRPIDSAETVEMSDFTLPLSNAQYRARVEELYQTVVDLGKKPIFREDDPVANIYDEAIKILDRYISNAWHTADDGEYRKVHTIHDWLVYYVDYDFALYDDYQSGAAVDNDSAFDLDGVFLNRRAVCNGLSRATTFMCAIEGIRSMRVTGTFLDVPHAWNKVNIGGKWYNIDVTADTANYTFDRGATYKKQLTHGYFLLSDKTYMQFAPNSRPASAHIFSSTVETAADYDYYTTFFSVDDDVYPMTVTSQKQLNDLFYDIGKAGGRVGKIEIKLSFPEKEAGSVNYGDIYANEIKEAYTHLNSPDFSVTDSSKPYIRYPNGVYLFLMYF